MAGSPTVARKKSEKFSGNINKRGVKREEEKKEEMPLSSTVVMVMLFIVVGSFFMGLLQNLNNQPSFDE